MELSQSDLRQYRRPYADSDLPIIHEQTFFEHTAAIFQKLSVVLLFLALLIALVLAGGDPSNVAI